MYRMQIYVDDNLFEEIKKEALRKGESISAFIRDVMKKEIRKKVDFSEIAGIWEDRDIDIKSLRKAAWKR